MAVNAQVVLSPEEAKIQAQIGNLTDWKCVTPKADMMNSWRAAHYHLPFI